MVETRIIEEIDKAFDEYMWMTQDPENVIQTAIRQHHEFLKDRIKHAVIMALYDRYSELTDVAWKADVTTDDFRKAREKAREIAFQMTGKTEEGL